MVHLHYHKTDVKNDQQQKYWSTESLFSSLQKITVLNVEKNTQGGRIFRFDWKEVTGRQEYISNQNRIYSYSNSFKYLLTVL